MITEAYQNSLLVRVFVTKPVGHEFDHQKSMVEGENSKVTSDCLAIMVVWHVTHVCARAHLHAHTPHTLTQTLNRHK